MDKAFDAVLQSEVCAAVIAKNSYRFNGDQFRYQCLCCGEEVYLAAADSIERAPHFRHRKGNNDKECERYLGQPGAVERFVLLRKQYKQDYIDFYFNRDRMTFEICVSFTEEELQTYEEENNRLTVSSKYYGDPFLSIPLSREVFIPNEKSYFTIMEISTNYFVSFNSGIDRFAYHDVMRSPEKINIFKVSIQDEHCRNQALSLLYTDTEYIAISENEAIIQELVSIEYVVSEELFSFVTENRVYTLLLCR